MENTKLKKIALIIIILLSFSVTLILIYNRKSKKTLVLENYSPSFQLKTIKDDLKANQYTLKNAKVYVNPFGDSPLSALIVFQTDKIGKIQIIVNGKNNDNFLSEYILNKYNYIPIYGLYEDYDNSVTLKLDTGESQTFNIRIDKLPTQLKYEFLSENNNSNIYLFNNEKEIWGIDNFGNTRFYLNGEYKKIEELSNGNILVIDYIDNLKEINLLGQTIIKYDIKNLQDFCIKNNDNIVALIRDNDVISLKEIAHTGVIKENKIKIVGENGNLPLKMSCSENGIVLSYYDNITFLNDNYDIEWYIDGENNPLKEIENYYPDYIIGTYMKGNELTFLALNQPNTLNIDQMKTITLTYTINKININNGLFNLINYEKLDTTYYVDGSLNKNLIIEQLEENDKLYSYLLDNNIKIKFENSINSAYILQNSKYEFSLENEKYLEIK